MALVVRCINKFAFLCFFTMKKSGAPSPAPHFYGSANSILPIQRLYTLPVDYDVTNRRRWPRFGVLARVAADITLLAAAVHGTVARVFIA